MSPFSYLSVIVSIILGLGISQLLKGFSRWLELRGSFRVFGPTIAWAFLLLLVLFQTWWSMYGMREYENWNFIQFAMVLLQPIVLFLLAVLVFPGPSSPHSSLRDHFFHQRLWFFGLILALLFVSLSKDLVRSGSLPEPANLGYHVAAIVLAGLGLSLKDERSHTWLAYVALLSFVVYVAVLFGQL